MTIETRGNQNIAVLSRTGVPIRDVCAAVVNRKKLDWICNRFPVTVSEVFECIDALADSFKKADYKSGITLINRGDDLDIQLETISVNETVFFSLISYGHAISPGALDFDEIYNTGLVKVISDIYTDLSQQKNYFESSELHSCIYDALLSEIGHVEPNVVLRNIQEGL